MKIVFVGYRTWFFDIIERVADTIEYRSFGKSKYFIVTPHDGCELAGDLSTVVYKNFRGMPIRYLKNPSKNLGWVKKINPDAIFFIGWSWMVPKDIVESYKCFCMHPSALPKYRGGSPIQNQVIDGVTTSALTLFQMNNKTDAGPVVYQKEISFSGTLNDIFDRIIEVGSQQIIATLSLLPVWSDNLLKPQDESKATTYKRRLKKDSLITKKELTESSSEYLYNKIRCLTSPYPNAYIECADGKKLYFTGAKIDDE